MRLLMVILTVLITDSMPHVTVLQDSAVAQMLLTRAQGYVLDSVGPGYRVQIYSSNKQQTAKNEAIGLEQWLVKQVQVPVYVQYVPPFWKVRLGDFTTYEQANEFKRSLISDYPELTSETYVVRDQIKVSR